MKTLLKSTSVAAFILFVPFSISGSSILGVASAFSQSVVNVGKVTLGSGGVVATISGMKVEGSAAGESEIRAMFDPKALDQLAKRFAAFSAQSITIPEIQINQKLGDGSTTITVYRNTVMRDIRNGVISEIITPQMTSRSDTKPGAKSNVQVETSSVDMMMKGLNITLMARFLTDKAQPGEVLQTALNEQTVGKTTLKFDKSEVIIERMAMSDLKLKPLATPLIQSIEAMGDDKKDSEKHTVSFARDLMGSFSIANMEAHKVSGNIIGDAKNSGRFNLNKMRFGGGANLLAGFAIEGFKAEMPDAKVGIGEFAINGIKYPQAAATPASAVKSDEFKPEDFIPTIEQFRIAGIEIDVPDTKDKSKRLKAKLGQFDIKMSNHFGFIPANIGILLDRMQMDIPAETNEKGLKDILALGYKALDVSMRYDQTYDQASKILKLNELSLNSVGMFAAKAKAELTNVAKEIFTMDQAIASVAALGVMAKSISIDVKNDSLFEKLIAQQATAQKRKPEDVRTELAAGATMMVPLFLGDHPGAKVLGAALGQFLANPKNLRVALTAKEGGVGAVDFLALKNPIDILKKVDITASSND